MSASPAAERELAALMGGPVTLRDGGGTRNFELSTTEVSVRGSDGARKLVSLDRTDSPGAFAAALERLRAGGGTEPELVLYPVGFPQNEFTRRIATRQVVITAPSRAKADVVAAARGLVFKKAPAFAEGSFIYEAPTAVAALAAQGGGAPALEVTPLLASRAAKRTMPNDPYTQLQWHLKYQDQQGAVAGTDINVESVWNYPSTSPSDSIRGRGVVIGIVDDGMEWRHPDLEEQAETDLQWDWNQGDGDPSPYYFSDAHGTACAGVAAAEGNNRIGVSGVAPEAGLAGLRLIADPATDLDEAEAMAWELDRIHISSNSWGPSDSGDILAGPDELTTAALRAATDFGRGGKGRIFTWAGGNGLGSNDNSNYDGYANSIYTIAVAAVGSDGVQAPYSEPGANIVVAAPSDGGPLGIMTTDNAGTYGYNPGIVPGDFPSSGDVSKTFGGTSSATPAVSGVIALMLEKNPDLGWRDVQEILIDSAAQVDAADPDWITNAGGFSFNHKYGAGLVDADAAVTLSGNWSNLPAQTSNSVALGLAVPQAIAPGDPPVVRSFSVTEALRAEHVTLAISITGITKGDLQIDLTSPAGTNSVLCEPHGDDINPLDGWTFMTVRNWGETSTGFWTLTIENTGAATGELSAAVLTVFGTPTSAPANPVPVVNLEATRSYPPGSTDAEEIAVARAYVGTAVTLAATASDKNADGSVGSIDMVEFQADDGTGAVLLGNATVPASGDTYTFDWTPAAAGNYTLTATATDGGTPSASATSSPLRVTVDPLPYAAWDFDTIDDAAQSTVSLATAIQSVRQYTANFGSNNGTVAAMLIDGTLGSSQWNVQSGEIWTGDGTDENLLADSNPFATNSALLLRGGRNLSANGKSIVFQVDMSNARRLEISYATEGSADGFTTHTWEYWDDDAEVWRAIEDSLGNPTVSVPPAYDEVTMDMVAGAGFNGRADARVRLTVSGATAISGTNLLDNIRFNATVAP